MGLLDRLNQKLGASGQPAEDAGIDARQEAKKAMQEKAREEARQDTQTATEEAAAILAGKEPSRVAGGIFFFDGDRMMVISEGGRFIQKQRAIRYDQLESYELVQDGEILARNSVSAIGNMGLDHDSAASENGETADTIIAGVKTSDTKKTDMKAADTKTADTKTAGVKAADTKTASMKKHCVSLSVIMYFKATLESSSGEPLERIEIPFITTKTKIGGFLYRTNRAPADQLIEALDLVIASCR